jgi:hypothetical protein
MVGPKFVTLRYLLAGLLAGLSPTAINTASDHNSGSTHTLLAKLQA